MPVRFKLRQRTAELPMSPHLRRDIGLPLLPSVHAALMPPGFGLRW
jgi:hypothetical protein